MDNPIDTVEWVNRDTLRANNYNPNHVAPAELRLLMQSILDDGWTQPIVALDDGEIVDGFHRWTVSGLPPMMKQFGGEVPVVRLRPSSRAAQKMSTIRHNRARGQHAVLEMASIVRSLVDEHGMDFEAVGKALQMEWDEVDRLYDNSGAPVRGDRAGEFSEGWSMDPDLTIYGGGDE